MIEGWTGASRCHICRSDRLRHRGERALGDDGYRPDRVDLHPTVVRVEDVRPGNPHPRAQRRSVSMCPCAGAVVITLRAVSSGWEMGCVSSDAPRLIGRNDFRDEVAVLVGVVRSVQQAALVGRQRQIEMDIPVVLFPDVCDGAGHGRAPAAHSKTVGVVNVGEGIANSTPGLKAPRSHSGSRFGYGPGPSGCRGGPRRWSSEFGNSRRGLRPRLGHREFDEDADGSDEHGERHWESHDAKQQHDQPVPPSFGPETSVPASLPIASSQQFPSPEGSPQFQHMFHPRFARQGSAASTSQAFVVASSAPAGMCPAWHSARNWQTRRPSWWTS